MTPAESLVERTGRVLDWQLERSWPDYFRLLRELPPMREPWLDASADKWDRYTHDARVGEMRRRRVVEALECWARALLWLTVSSYLRCVLGGGFRAGSRVFRSGDVQLELRQRAMRVARSVMS